MAARLCFESSCGGCLAKTYRGMTRTRLHLNLDGLRVHGTRWQPCAGLRASPGFASIGCLPPRGLAVLWFCALGEFCKLGEFCSLVLNGHWGYCRGFPAPSVLGMLGLILLGLIHIAGVDWRWVYLAGVKWPLEFGKLGELSSLGSCLSGFKASGVEALRV